MGGKATQPVDAPTRIEGGVGGAFVAIVQGTDIRKYDDLAG